LNAGALIFAILFSGTGATPSELALARNEFKRGVAATKKENWDEAHEAFTRAYTLSRRPEILLNLGGAQAKTGRLVEARESYQRFLREASKSDVAKHRAGVEATLKEIEPRIPKAVITVNGLEPGDRLKIDGAETALAILGAELPLNPGGHAVALERNGEESTRAEFSLAEGATELVALDATRPASPAPSLPLVVETPAEPPAAIVEAPPAEDNSIFASPIFWIVAGALAIGGAVAAGVVLGGGEESYRGTSGIVLEGLEGER
jgi:tetratricopeptide (TPR) repeat protein